MSMEMDERKELEFLDHGFADWPRSDQFYAVVLFGRSPVNKVVVVPVNALTVIYFPN